LVALKWAGVLVAVVVVPLDALANLLLFSVGSHTVPAVVNGFAVGLAVAGGVMALISHVSARLELRIDAVAESLSARLEDMERRIGDRNSGFVEGYMLSQVPESTVVPLAPRARNRRSMIASSED
jgi:hypothetical protein